NKRFDMPLRFAGMSVGYGDRESHGTLGLGTISIEVTKARVDPTLVTGNPIHVVKPGEEGQLAIVLENPASREASVTLSYVITRVGHDDAPRHAEQAVVVAGDGQTQVRLPAPTRYGVHKVD